MQTTNWLKQTPDKPLFPDLLWSRPENKRQAGKLLIIGGSSHGFAAPAQAYTSALKAGIGTVRVILPEANKKALGKSFLEADFAPNNSSGSFSRQALSQFLENSSWADGVLLAGDFGRNSETAILLESFLNKYTRQVTVADDSLDYFLEPRSLLLNRAGTTLVIDLAKLQKLAQANRPTPVIKYSLSLHNLVEALAGWTNEAPTQIITKHNGHFLVASGGQVSTTPVSEESNWQVELAAYASVWRLQQPQKSFEALTAAVLDYLK
jgi:hypothetical protein